MKVAGKKGVTAKPAAEAEQVAGADPQVIQYLSRQYPSSAERRLEIKHLWDNYYRLNFWGERVTNPKKPACRIIIDSQFVRVMKDDAGTFELQVR